MKIFAKEERVLEAMQEKHLVNEKRTSHDVRQRENINPLYPVFSVLALATTHKQNTLGW